MFLAPGGKLDFQLFQLVGRVGIGSFCEVSRIDLNSLSADKTKVGIKVDIVVLKMEGDPFLKKFKEACDPLFCVAGVTGFYPLFKLFIEGGCFLLQDEGGFVEVDGAGAV